MIKEIKKDITTVEDGIVVHGCNCSGGFGSGVAGAIRKKWPWVYDEFKKTGKGKHLLGQVHFFVSKDNPLLIVGNGYTQEKYGKDGKKYASLDAIEKVLDESIYLANALKKDLYMPKIGCGLGGLLWENEVKPILEKVNNKYPEVNIFVCNIK